MDSTDSITFTSELTFWDKFKCFYLLDFYSRISLYNAKKWQRILGHLIYIFICIIVAITLFSDADLGPKLFDIFCFLSFFWMPAITSFKVARNIPNNVQLILIPGNTTETSNTPSLKVLYSDTRIDRFKNAILFDTTNFYIIIYYNNVADKRVQLVYSIISKKQNNDILAKFNFVKTISPDLKKIIKLHI